MKYILLVIQLVIFSGSVNSSTNPYDEAMKLVNVGEYRKAFDIALVSAKEGHARSQYIVGFMLAKGRGVEMNCQEGLSWLHKSSEAGYYAASYMLGVFSLLPKHPCATVDTEKAREYMEKASAQGMPKN
ncbi:MAG: tetratricopeptide repeat protein [Sedimenticola sp.]